MMTKTKKKTSVTTTLEKYFAGKGTEWLKGTQIFRDQRRINKEKVVRALSALYSSFRIDVKEECDPNPPYTITRKYRASQELLNKYKNYVPTKQAKKPVQQLAQKIADKVLPPVSKPTEPKIQLNNNIHMLLDGSGSMATFVPRVQQLVRDTINVIKDETSKANNRSYVSVSSFCSRFPDKSILSRLEVRDFGSLNLNNYSAFGDTPLWDAIASSIKQMKNGTSAQDPNQTFLLYVLTDGENNSSKEYDAFRVATLINEVQATDRWTIAVLTPPGKKDNLVKLGIPEGNVKEWEVSDRGFTEAYSASQTATRSFVNQTNAGVKKSTTFYANVVDPKKVVKKLDDVTDTFVQWTVEKENNIRSFVEEKLASPKFKYKLYETGKAFYKLTKTAGEKIQARKEIVLRDKVTKKILGGDLDTVRGLLGIPAGQGEVKVKPGDHRNYDIFVQSESLNRILPRDAELLYKVK